MLLSLAISQAKGKLKVELKENNCLFLDVEFSNAHVIVTTKKIVHTEYYSKSKNTRFAKKQLKILWIILGHKKGVICISLCQNRCSPKKIQPLYMSILYKIINI